MNYFLITLDMVLILKKLLIVKSIRKKSEEFYISLELTSSTQRQKNVVRALNAIHLDLTINILTIFNNI